MSEEEKKAIEEINKYTMYLEQQEYLNIILNLIEKQAKELELKDKVIDETVKMIEEYTGSCPFDMYDWSETNCDEGSNCENVKVCWKQYFINKVKENKE